MNDKSHVSLEQRVCLVCGAVFDTGSILLDKRLRASMEHRTTTGWGLCVEHQRLFDEGYVALVECDPQRSGSPSAGDKLKPEQAYRTGPPGACAARGVRKAVQRAGPGRPSVHVRRSGGDRLAAQDRGDDELILRRNCWVRRIRWRRVRRTPLCVVPT